MLVDAQNMPERNPGWRKKWSLADPGCSVRDLSAPVAIEGTFQSNLDERLFC